MIERTLLSAGINKIAGVDEAGRGPCAGPLVIAAVILPAPTSDKWREINDSKKLTESKREELFNLITENCVAHCIIEISAAEIDSKSLHKCNIEGMRRAIQGLQISAEYVLTDGYAIPGLEQPNLAVWKGDQVSVTVGAASILAKVYRDRLMTELSLKFPGYGLEQHKGYITAEHTAALKKLGVSEIHRKSFANVAELLNK